MLLIWGMFTPLYSAAYEASKQEKIDAVNSYQPLEFARHNAADPNTISQNNLTSLKYKAPKISDIYIENIAIDKEYISESPVGKLTEAIEKGLTKPPEDGFIPVANQQTPNDSISDEDQMMLNGTVFQEDKPRKKIFTHRNWDKVCTFIKGEPAYDALILGMQSTHTSPDRATKNNTNNMLALQYGGVAAGTFENSWYKQTYFVTVARRMWKKELNNNWSIDFQYKAGIMHGYENRAPVRLGWIEPVILPIVGINYKKRSGADIIVVPSARPVFAISFRMGLPEPMTYQSVHAKIAAKRPKKPEQPLIDNYKQIQPEQQPVEPTAPAPAIL